MEENTVTFQKPTGREHAKGSESKLFDVSVRGWIALMVTATLCMVVLWGIEVKNATFHDVVLLCLGGYFTRGMQAAMATSKTSPDKPLT